MLTRDRAGTFVAVLVGSVIVTTFLLLLTSARPKVPDRFAGFTAVIQSPAAANGPDEFAEPVPWPAATVIALTERIGVVPGVTSVMVDRDFYAQPLRDGQPVPGVTRGHAWHGPDQAGAMVDDDLGYPIGSGITLMTGSGEVRWRVAGHTDLPGVHLPEAAATALAPGVRHLGVSGDFDPAALRAAIGAEGTVLTGDGRGLAEPRDDARLRWIGTQVLTATAAIAAFACVFLVSSTSAYEVNQRRREIGLLRAVGATPGQVRAILFRSALLLGAVASAVGVLLGALLANPLSSILMSERLEPAGYTVHWEPWVLGVSLAAGPLIALLGAAIAARGVSRISPVEALRTAELEPRAMSRIRWLAGSAAAVAGMTAGAGAAASGSMRDLGSYALLGAMALIVAAALLAPAVVPALIRLFLAPLRGIIATLARESARTAVRRTASTATPVLFAVAFAVFVTGTVQTSAAAWDTERGAIMPPGAILMPAGTPGLHDGIAGRAPLDSVVYIDGRALTASGTDEVSPGTALVAGLPSNPASVPHPRAETITVTWSDGATETLRVAGLAPPGPLTAELVVNRDAARRHDPSALVPAVYPAPAAAAGPGAVKTGPEDLARQTEADDDQLIGTFTVLLLVVSAGAGAVTVVNTLLMTARRRGPDHRVLRLSGATGGQVLRAVALETALAVAIGSLLGGIAGVIAIAGSARALSEQIGHDVPVLISWPMTAGTILACLLFAVAAATIPASRFIRRPAADR
ncbi:ABC transporter permease [Actinoplanes derwentensis]|uniref:Putative ABC transport system permease protein n=1 Tax=Actinoplanes derwentensis TaxID=113562 RepID=A0A1H2AC42_9ACTN|nr:ABC transporter permease [Actinoplanes derwentensis]GID88945.1 ABC transporter permease [Actinoplanes derwentensis]SDT43531.1 putative ABC transport system permease protein [Actinoplanes derwentensis]